MRLLKIAEVAHNTGVSDRSVHRWIESGMLRAVKIGGSTRIKEEDLAEFVAKAPARSAKTEKAGPND